MRFLKKLFNGSQRLGETGIIHLIPLLILLLGIIAGVYLVQHPQIFKPKATQKTIEILPGDCVKEKDGKQVLVCDRFQFKVTSPLETGQTSDAGPTMSFVKTVYAATFPNGYCKDNKSIIYYKIGSEEREGRFCRDNAECKEVEGGADCIKTVATGGRDWVCKNNNTLQKCFFRVPVAGWCIGEETQTCPSDQPVCKADGNSATCVEKEQPAPVVGSPAPTCTNDIGCTDGNVCTEDKCVDGKCVYSNKSAGSICEYDPSTREPIKECSSNGQCEAKKLAPAPGVQQPPIGPAPGRPPQAEVPQVPTSPASQLAKCGDNPSTLKPGERPQGYSWVVADCAKSCSQNKDCPVSTDGYTRRDDSTRWCYQFQEGLRCMVLKYTATAAPAAEKVTISPSPSPQTTRYTIKFRLAANPLDLERAPWYGYTAGGVTISAPSPYYSIGAPTFGIKSIFVQFLDNQNQIIKFSGDSKAVESIEFVDIASIKEAVSPSPAGGGPAVGAASCRSVTMASGNGNPGGNGALQLAYTGSPAKVQVWIASNDFRGKSANEVTSWTKVADTSASSYVTFTIPQSMELGSHAVLVSLHDANGNMLDGNPDNTVNPKCASSINIQSGTTTTQPAPAEPTGRTFQASCNLVNALSGASAGGVGTLNLDYSGNPVYTQVWIASNDAVGKSVDQVGNYWTLVRDYAAAAKGLISFNVPSSVTAGTHAVLVALFDPQLNMLDGNPNGTVNPKCASSMIIQ